MTTIFTKNAAFGQKFQERRPICNIRFSNGLTCLNNRRKRGEEQDDS
jgi:hypothetical protein